ncbi:uncharacterized protein An08g05430 [Aspergillus niger]|uniref:Contig An08c0130, genomic contig n=2 Tax=Aspergillus niger TaxID=5061 RepID=A2QRB4_ASPNC|nr:uncharacterized protein An08g05430 [Aspergillus niger]CAK45515.1 unnamed protein product [Aspergillus niger]
MANEFIEISMRRQGVMKTEGRHRPGGNRIGKKRKTETHKGIDGRQGADQIYHSRMTVAGLLKV